MIKHKKAAMEMSVGTIVTIVLLMAVLILGLTLVRTIFFSSTENIKIIDEAIKSQMRVLFSEDTAKKIIILPASRMFSIKSGDSGGFAISIRNTGRLKPVSTFSYEVKVIEVAHTCSLSLAQADNLLILGRDGSLQIPSGDVLETPIHVNFRIPEDAPLCDINYGVNIKKDGALYTPTITVKLEIK